MDFPIDFPKCPSCGCTDTIYRLAGEEETGKKLTPNEALKFTEKTIALLSNPVTVIGVTVPVIIRHYDDCAKCGLRYCIRAEKGKLPFQMQMPSGHGQGGMPFTMNRG